MTESQPFRALNSASNIYRRRLCPGSAQAEEGLPELNSNPNAERGTFLHAKEQQEDFGDLKAAEVRALEKNKRLSEGFIQATIHQLCLDAEDAGKPINPGEPKVFKEREFFLCDAGLEPVYPPFPGHTDEIVWYPDISVAFVFDSKFGRHPVTRSELNLQLRSYAAMVFDDLGAQRIYAAIRQPYLRAPDDFHSVEYLASDVPAARAEILGIIEDSKKPEAKRIPSIDACAFCRAKGTSRCPESQKLIRNVNGSRVRNLEPHKLEKLGEDMKMAIGIANAWYERMKMIAGVYPELLKLWELAPAQVIHKVKSPDKAYVQLASHFSDGEEFLRECCTVSLPKLASCLSKKLGVSHDAAEDLVFRELGDNIESTPKERSLVRTSRP